MCNIGKWTAVYEGRSILCGLYEVWHECVFEQYADCTCATQVLDSEWGAVIAIAEEDILNATTEILARGSQAEDSHDLRRRGDVKTALCGDAIIQSAEALYNLAETAVVDVKYTLPEYLLERWKLLAALIEVVVHQRSNHVVS